MFRSALEKIQTYAKPALRLGPYSTARKISDDFVSQLKMRILSKNPFYKRLNEISDFPLAVPQLYAFSVALGYLLEQVMGENYLLYQTLNEEAKDKFRKSIVERLFICLQEDEKGKRMHQFHREDADFFMEINLPCYFSNFTYLKDNLSPIIQKQMETMIRDHIESLSVSKTYFSSLPKDLRIELGHFLFFQHFDKKEPNPHFTTPPKKEYKA